MTNIDVGRAWAKNYYGAHNAAGPRRGVGHAAEPAEQLCERGAVGRLQGANWLHARRHVSHRAIVLDVDDTS